MEVIMMHSLPWPRPLKCSELTLCAHRRERTHGGNVLHYILEECRLIRVLNQPLQSWPQESEACRKIIEIKVSWPTLCRTLRNHCGLISMLVADCCKGGKGCS